VKENQNEALLSSQNIWGNIAARKQNSWKLFVGFSNLCKMDNEARTNPVRNLSFVGWSNLCKNGLIQNNHTTGTTFDDVFWAQKQDNNHRHIGCIKPPMFQWQKQSEACRGSIFCLKFEIVNTNNFGNYEIGLNVVRKLPTSGPNTNL